MSRMIKLSTIAGIGTFLYAAHAKYVEKRSITSKIAEDLIRVANSDLTAVDEEMLARNFEENQKEYIIPKSIIQSRIKSEMIADMKVFTVEPRDIERTTKVLYLHGGGYIHQPSVFHWRFIQKMSDETGMTFIVPIYPKAPEYSFEDAYEAVAELYEQLAGEELVIMGDSAGGGLALGFTQWLKAEGHPLPKGVIIISPWLDITLNNPDIEEYGKTDPMLKADNLKIIGRIWAGDGAPSLYKVSPMYGELEGLPKIFTFVGTREICLPDARVLVRRLKEAGADYEYYEYPMMNHVFPLYPIKEGIEARKKINEILISL